jgi:hypothetical protein
VGLKVFFLNGINNKNYSSLSSLLFFTLLFFFLSSSLLEKRDTKKFSKKDFFEQRNRKKKRIKMKEINLVLWFCLYNVYAGSTPYTFSPPNVGFLYPEIQSSCEAFEVILSREISDQTSGGYEDNYYYYYQITITFKQPQDRKLIENLLHPLLATYMSLIISYTSCDHNLDNVLPIDNKEIKQIVVNLDTPLLRTNPTEKILVVKNICLDASVQVFLGLVIGENTFKLAKCYDQNMRNVF